ncbi:MAG: Segregation and condensation protein A [Parcubacteria group bacterium GW2011_GWA2_44_15]|nr:MAG: Segregation and condensation protein A [Parcubacteria group bacterium GW2011_GWA2_44_15]
MTFTVKQQSFEGPLDVLLTLIEKRKLFINDISLAKVADDYLAHIKTLNNFPIADSANFVLIASTLVLIKSKSLLPALELTEEEQGDIADLERRLKIYRRIKELSVDIKNRFGKKISFSPEPRKVEPVFSPDAKMSIASLVSAVRDVLKNLPKKEFLPKAIIEKVMSLEEMITHLTKRVADSLRISFREFSKTHKGGKIHVIISFLAMLELVKQGIISVSQERHGDDILMETEHLGVPKY